MNLPAVVHRPTPEYIYPRARDQLTIQITTAREDVKQVTLVFWPRYETSADRQTHIPMKRSLRDAYHDCYRTTIQTEDVAAYVRYYFVLESDEETVWLGAKGFSDKEPAINENFFEFLWPNEGDGYCAPDWHKQQVYYQIFPERYRSGDDRLTPSDADPWGSPPTRENFMGGDIQGIIQGLDHICDLGATCLYLTPIFNAPSNHKYDTVDYYEIDPSFGTKEDLRKLVSEVHKRGLRLILDGVFNHCGYYWPPFQDLVRNGANSKYRDWFFPQGYPVTLDPCNYDCVGHYKWMPKINLNCPDAAEYFIRVGEYWIREFGIDGWRLDVADEVPASFWQKFSSRIKQLKPDALLLGETWGDAQKLVTANRLDTAMNYLFREAMVGWLGKRNLSVSRFDDQINRMLSLYPEEVALRLYNPLDSHDTARFMFECQNDLRRFKLAVALQMTLPGCPAVFYGDEVGLTGDNDPLCRVCMEWDGEKQNRDLFEWYQKLIALRKNSPSLYEGDYATVLCDDEHMAYGFRRQTDDESCIVLVNAGEADYFPRLAVEPGAWTEMLSQTYVTKDAELLCAKLPAYSVNIYKNRKEDNHEKTDHEKSAGVRTCSSDGIGSTHCLQQNASRFTSEL